MEPQRSVFDFGITVERLPDGRWAVTCPSDEFAGMYGTGSWTVPTYDDAIDLVRAAAGLISGARALVEVGSQKIDDMAAAACHASRTTVSGDAP